MSVILISVASLFFIITPGKSRLKSYYSGEAISYKNNLYIATTNTGSLELFVLNNSNLDLVAKVRPYNYRFNNYKDFYDVALSIENNRLYAYAISEYTIYKYEVLPQYGTISLVNESKNTYWEWYNQINKFGNDIVTVSAKGTKIFNTDLEAIVTHDFVNKQAPYNISSTNDRFFLNIDDNKNILQVYDRESRTMIKEIPLNFKYDKGNRRAYQDAAGYIYVVDDYYTKKFDLSGKLLASFRHLDYQGFEVSGTGHTDYVYFTNGVGIVKLDKQMKEVDYTWTGNLGAQGGWAMGLETVYNNGEKIVIFNNTNILVLDANLNKVAVTLAKEEADKMPLENLYISIDKYRAPVNGEIQISGGGYYPYEQLTITFGKEIITTVSDSSGRFEAITTVPQLRAGRHDIRVEGVNSQLHYSTSFQVE